MRYLLVSYELLFWVLSYELGVMISKSSVVSLEILLVMRRIHYLLVISLVRIVVVLVVVFVQDRIQVLGGHIADQLLALCPVRVSKISGTRWLIF